MLITDDQKMLFIHIPKCAGTSIRKSLSAITAFPVEAFMNDGIAIHDAEKLVQDASYDHPDLGRIKLDHLPLKSLRDYFPHVWSLLCGAHSFAVVRNPRDRFISGLRQRLREFKGLGQADVTTDELRREAQDVSAALEERDYFCDAEYIHLAKQADFTNLSGKRIVDKVFSMTALEEMRAWIASQCGTGVASFDNNYNQSLRLRGVLAHAAKTVKPIYKNAVPAQRRSKIRAWINSSPLVRPAAQNYGAINLGDDVEKFILQYYAEDWSLYEELHNPGTLDTSATV
jgi:hypothetical protein